jgi:hypothetical protein
VTSTLRAGCDQAQEVFERARARARRSGRTDEPVRLQN